MASPSFEYPSLDRTKSQIRLLEILPQPDSSLQYNLTTFDVSTCPPYIALSYVWGNSRPRSTILINGKCFTIRDNLSYALPHLAKLRDGGNKSEFMRPEKHLWIDAICINQTDTKERNHQVEMMKDIFTCASLTVAWLGPINEDLRSLRPATVNDKPKGSTVKKVLKNIASNRYFTRIWIVQEIILSKDIWIMCGSEICTWEDLERSWGKHRRSIDMDNNDDPEFHTSVQSPWLRLHTTVSTRAARDQNDFRLDDLVYIFSDRQCGEPRDRIYALLGLVSPKLIKFNPLPVVDYDTNLHNLFSSVWRHFMHYEITSTHIHRKDKRFGLQFALGIAGDADFIY